MPTSLLVFIMPVHLLDISDGEISTGSIFRWIMEQLVAAYQAHGVLASHASTSQKREGPVTESDHIRIRVYVLVEKLEEPQRPKSFYLFHRVEDLLKSRDS